MDWLKHNWLGIAICAAILLIGTVATYFYYAQQQIASITAEANQKIIDLQKKMDATQVTLKNNVQNTQNENSDYSTLVAEWKDQVAQVTCSWNYINTGKLYQADEASALIANVTGFGNVAVTNAHVITDSNGYLPTTCTVGVYGLGSRTVQYRQELNPFSKYERNGVSYDFAFIQLDDKFLASKTGSNIFSPDPSKNAAGKVCPDGDAIVGDKLIVLGYPAIGTVGGITVTEGIVSGLEGDYYVTSAKIDHGNSGGVAVLMKDDCYLGIPTWAANNGGFESLGRILKGRLLFTPKP